MVVVEAFCFAVALLCMWLWKMGMLTKRNQAGRHTLHAVQPAVATDKTPAEQEQKYYELMGLDKDFLLDMVCHLLTKEEAAEILSKRNGVASSQQIKAVKQMNSIHLTPQVLCSAAVCKSFIIVFANE